MMFWNDCLAQVGKVVNSDDLTTWIKPLQPSVEGDTLVLYAPNAFVCEQVEGRLLEIIKQHLPDSIGTVLLRIGVRPGGKEKKTQSKEAATLPTASQKNRPKAEPLPNQLVSSENIWSDAYWAQSSDLVRTALFTANRYGPDETRPTRFNLEIFSQGNIKIIVTGEETNTTDEDVFMQLLHYQRRYTLGSRIGFSLSELAQDLELAKSGKANKRLISSIRRLQRTTVEMQFTTPGRVKGYQGQLINDFYYDKTEHNAQYSVTFNPEIARLFLPNFTRINRIQDGQLRSDLSKRLHRYYSSHKQPLPVSVEFLWKISGSAIKDPRKFKQKLKASLEELKEVGFLANWELDERNMVRVVRAESNPLLG